MEKYPNLKLALYPYRGDLDLDNRQRSNMLRENIAGGYIDIVKLRSEFQDALSNPDFDWVNFATENCLMIESSSEATETAGYVKTLLRDYLSSEE